MIVFNGLKGIMQGGLGGDSNGFNIADATRSDFAKGGVMTGYGPMDLKHYSRGGIASQPQLAMFGEGAVPEAYVPLPDGRSIPVTMKGSGSGEVQVNIFNEGGQQMSGQSKSKFDGEKMIIDVFLKNVSKPGPVREAVRGIR